MSLNTSDKFRLEPENRSYKIFYTNLLTLIRKYNKIVKAPFKLKSFEEMNVPVTKATSISSQTNFLALLYRGTNTVTGNSKSKRMFRELFTDNCVEKLINAL